MKLTKLWMLLLACLLSGLTPTWLGCTTSDGGDDAAGVPQPRVAAQLEERGRLMYAPGEQQPFSGRKASLHSNGQKEEEGEVKAGKRVGTWSQWYPDGQKSSHGPYQNGSKTGRWTHWYENGQKSSHGA